MEYGQQKQRAAMMEESKMASYGASYGADIRSQTATLGGSSPSLNMKSSPVDVDLDGIERELVVLLDNLSILRQRLNLVLCDGFSFIERPGEPMREGSPLSHRLTNFRSCIAEANSRIEALKNGLEI